MLKEKLPDDQELNQGGEPARKDKDMVIEKIGTVNLPKEYGISDAKIAELAEKYKDLREIKDTASRSMAAAGRRECRELRVAIENKRKELKADALEFGRKVDGEAKRVTELLRQVEEPLDALIKADEALREEAKQAKLRAIAEAEAKERARVDGIKALMDRHFGPAAVLALHSMPTDELAKRLETAECVAQMGDDYAEFTEEAHHRRDEFLAKARSILAEKREAESAAEAQLIEAERFAEERRAFEEQQRLVKEQQEAEQKERDRLESERQAAIRAEQEKLEAERAEIRKQQEAIEAEKRRVEEEKQAKERAAAEAIRQQEFAEQAKVRAEQEFKEKQQREELERLAREEAERKEQERLAALLPDREKIRAYGIALALSISDPPRCDTREGQLAIQRIVKRIHSLNEYINGQADKLEDSDD